MNYFSDMGNYIPFMPPGGGGGSVSIALPRPGSGPALGRPIDRPGGVSPPVYPTVPGNPIGDDPKPSISDLLSNPYVLYGGGAIGLYVVYRFMKRK